MRARRSLLVGLGALWLLDGLLQLQPAMFSSNMLSGLWAPVAGSNPQWLGDLVTWAIDVVRSWLPLFNSLVAATQLLVGLMLVSGLAKVVRLGLWASLVFGLGVWVFGEGMGGVLAGGASIVTGAPGSALLYSLGSAALLTPPTGWRRWQDRWGIDPLRAVTAAVLFVGALWQCAGPNWTAFGLSAPPADDFMMPQPGILRAALSVASGVAMRAPAVTNLLLVTALLGGGAAVVLGARSTLALAAVLALFALIWVCGQDAGLLFSGGATDPNTMPLLALFAYAGWVGRGGRKPLTRRAAVPA